MPWISWTACCFEKSIREVKIDEVIMAELYPYPRFSLAERDRRWKAVRELMRQHRIDVIVTSQNTGHFTDFHANSRYLTHCAGGGMRTLPLSFPWRVRLLPSPPLPRGAGPWCRIRSKMCARQEETTEGSSATIAPAAKLMAKKMPAPEIVLIRQNLSRSASRARRKLRELPRCHVRKRPASSPFQGRCRYDLGAILVCTSSRLY